MDGLFSIIRNRLFLKFNFKGILIHLLCKTTSQVPVNCHCSTNNIMYLIPEFMITVVSHKNSFNSFNSW